MKRAAAIPQSVTPKKAKYANAYKVSFEADFPWVTKSPRSVNHAFCRPCNRHICISSCKHTSCCYAHSFRLFVTLDVDIIKSESNFSK